MEKLKLNTKNKMLERELQKYFNFSEFRSGQKEVVESIMAGKDVVALMPTGGGKSLCFQLPAII
ncbi:MAG: ATP-dependent DNA helicase RecQ, ATP-dependent DNA helicase RecQ, partial [Parcubacteria group bacterium GW2011_GWC1_45_14]